MEQDIKVCRMRTSLQLLLPPELNYIKIIKIESVHFSIVCLINAYL